MEKLWENELTERVKKGLKVVRVEGGGWVFEVIDKVFDVKVFKFVVVGGLGE